MKRLGLSLVFLCLFAPVMAQAACCKCLKKTSPTSVICLTDPTTTCADILLKNDYNADLAGLSCLPARDAECKPVASGGSGICQSGPMAPAAYTATPVTAVPSEPVAIITAPTLNIPIPGLNFTTNIPVYANSPTADIPFLAQYLAAIYNYFFGIVVITAAVMIVYGGFKYILSSTVGGIKDGKEVVTDAIIGLLLAFGTYTVLQTLNPALTNLNPLKVAFVMKEESELRKETEDFIPNNPKDALAPNDPMSVELAAKGTTTAGKNTGCVGTPAYQVKPSGCSGDKGCYEKYCVDGAIKPGLETPAGYYKVDDLVKQQNGMKNFSFFPESKDDQIAQYGIYVGSSKNERIGKGLRAEAFDGLLRAGLAAKAKGYFIHVYDTTRTWDDQLRAFCQRMKQYGNPVGASMPGASPHQVGVAIDANLEEIVPGKPTPVLRAGGPPICACADKDAPRPCQKNVNQVDTQIALGVKYLRTFEDIMAAGGFYHYCQENWHFDFGGVYSTLDCTRCAFPPDPPRGGFECVIHSLDKLKAGE